MVELIENNTGRIALLISADLPNEKVHFISDVQDGLQLGIINRNKGEKILPHYHLPIEINYHGPKQEFIYVEKGAVKVTFYDCSNQRVAERRLIAGCALLQLSGGHGFEFEETTRLVEVKQGPYINQLLDKAFIE